MTSNPRPVAASPPAADAGPAGRSGVPARLVVLLAVACGVTVANLYYAQPLLSTLSDDFHVGTATAGALVTATQLGYVLGMLFLVPLGDRFEKRGLVAILLAVATAALGTAGAATGFPVLLAASVLIGATSVVAQILVPLAASLAPDRTRGRVVGRVMSGLLTGILLSRTVSSLVAGAAGWRVVYLGSAVLMALLALTLRRALPAHAPTTDIPYRHVLRSTARLVRTHPGLLRRGLYQAALFGAFSAFWTTVSFQLTGPLHYSATGVALFALVGAAGAGAAPLAGRWADRGRTRVMTGVALLVAVLALGLAWAGGSEVVLLAAAAILLDMAVQVALVLGQHAVYQLDPNARARLNSVFVAVFFLGGAIGAEAGSLAYHAGGWTAVCVVAGSLPTVALLFWTTEPRRIPRPVADSGARR